MRSRSTMNTLLVICTSCRYFFASAMNKILNNDTFKVHQILFLFVCLGFLFHARTFTSCGDDIITDKVQQTLNFNRSLWLSRVMEVLARVMPAATLVIFANSRPQGCRQAREGVCLKTQICCCLYSVTQHSAVYNSFLNNTWS